MGRAVAGRALPDDVLPLVCDCLDLEPLVAARSASSRWRSAGSEDNLWRQLFVERWLERQKTAMVRDWWRALREGGIAAAPARTLTAQVPAAPHQPDDASYRRTGSMRDAIYAALERSGTALQQQAEAGTWHARFVLAELDARREQISLEELCYDLARDPRRGGARFGRRWMLAAGAARPEWLTDEMCFGPCGSIDARSCLLGLNGSADTMWTWRFPEDGGRNAVELRNQDDMPVRLDVLRTSDAGFALKGPSGLVLTSRERTEEEHLYRSYNVLRFPRMVTAMLEAVYDGRLPTPCVFPERITSFERLATHQLASRLGLLHESTGVGLSRRIIVWRPTDEVPDLRGSHEAGSLQDVR